MGSCEVLSNAWSTVLVLCSRCCHQILTLPRKRFSGCLARFTRKLRFKSFEAKQSWKMEDVEFGFYLIYLCSSAMCTRFAQQKQSCNESARGLIRHDFTLLQDQPVRNCQRPQPSRERRCRALRREAATGCGLDASVSQFI